jgi:hypothetical protein
MSPFAHHHVHQRPNRAASSLEGTLSLFLLHKNGKEE